MSSLDLVRASLARPMEWGLFERMVCEILGRDDMPSLRLLGGVADGGVDAIEELFYENEARARTIVQITRQRAQLAKYQSTVRRLTEAKKVFDQLVMVYGHPVETTTKISIQRDGASKGILVDIRDEDYLVRHLGDVRNGLYLRYFGDVREQVRHLLSDADPLEIADTRMRRAVLASLGAYVTKPAARVMRTTLFDRTVLGAIVENAGRTNADVVLKTVRTVLPGETITQDRVRASFERLRAHNLCTLAGEEVLATECALEAVGVILTTITAAIEQLRRQVIVSVAKKHALDDAARGRLERNVKRAATILIRRIGPTRDAARDAAMELAEDHLPLAATIGEGFSSDVTRSAIAAFSTFVRDDRNMDLLAKLARSYQAFFIRNMDPLGRRFQQLALSRSVMVLDTDVILAVLIEELPSHKALAEALVSLSNEGVKLIVPRCVLIEAKGHIERARKSYSRFGGALKRLPEGYVNAQVWHAVVRGYYYFVIKGGKEDFYEYWRRYYDESTPMEYLCFVLGKRIRFEIKEPAPLPDEDREDYDALVIQVLECKEKWRAKAEFRDQETMLERTKADVQCALDIAQLDYSLRIRRARGYIVSNDSAFCFMQELDEWKNRARVHLRTEQLPGLAEVICGVRLHDDDIVNIVFSPVHIAAAEQVADRLLDLARAGVDLRNASIERLEWDVTHDLENELLQYATLPADDGTNAADRVDTALRLSGKAAALGYDLDPAVAEIIREYVSVKNELAAAKARGDDAVKIAERVVNAATGLSKKGRRRVHAILREIGGLPWEADGTSIE